MRSSNWMSLCCLQFFLACVALVGRLKNTYLAELRKYFFKAETSFANRKSDGPAGGKRDRLNGGVIVLSLPSLFANWHRLRGMLCVFCIVSFFFVLNVTNLLSQPVTIPNLEWVVKDIEDRLQKGDRKAIRDLTNVWKVAPNNEVFPLLAKKYLILTSEEFDWSDENIPHRLQELYYQKEKDFQYSDFLKSYYLTPIESRKVAFQLEEQAFNWQDQIFLKTTKKNIAYALKKKKPEVLQEAILQISGLAPSVKTPILKDILLHSRFSKIKPTSKRNKIVHLVLEQLPDTTAIAIVFQLGDKRKLSLKNCQDELANITNHFLEAKTLKDLKLQCYQLINQYKGDFKIIKAAGYQNSLTTLPIFFEESSDYFAWILSTMPSDTLVWIRENAYQELINSQQPKVLFYLAGLQYQSWKGDNSSVYLNKLNRLIDVYISVKNKEGQMVTDYSDAAAKERFLLYWSQHYEDYEWDNTTNNFTNILKKTDLVDAYEKHFRRLNSTNDTIAVESFKLLTEGIPDEINRLIKKYRPLLRTYNAKLPPLDYNILENLSHLTNYCRKQGIIYKPTANVQQQLIKLEQDLSPPERYQLENELIAHLQLEELTSLEYFASINAQNTALNFSIGRILDRLYSKYWENIINNNFQFRFYLLKSTLFKDLSNFGIARLYYQKATDQRRLHDRLLEMEVMERNDLIKEAILYWKGKEEVGIVSSSVKELLNDPESFSEEEVERLKKFTSRELTDYFFVLKSLRNRQALKKMKQYMFQYASVEIVPELFKIPIHVWEDNLTAAKVAIKILEEVYAFSYSKNTSTSLEKWYQLWETDKVSYTTWGKYLFDLQLIELTTKEVLTIRNVNTITQSKYYREKHRIICLKALSRVDKPRSIPQLAIEPSLSVKEELHYLEKIAFSYRELDNLSKNVLIDDPLKWLDFLLHQSQDFNIDQNGFLYNNLFRQEWLFQLTTKGQIPNLTRLKILGDLKQYLNESAYLTEFEEEATQLNILLLLHNRQSLEEKLAILNDPDLDVQVKMKWLGILFARMDFKEVGQVFTHLDQLEDFDELQLMPFIRKEFGIPVFKADKAIVKTLQKQLATMDIMDIYIYYLDQFGVDYKTRKKELDFDKINNILTYDLVVPFVGQGGQYRDDHVYAIIKVLELHFNTTLDFSSKLNEFQSFFQFNSFSRVKAWKKFLKEKNLVKDTAIYPSFNEDF